MVYKGTTKEITGSKSYRRYTLHNDRHNQRDQGRKCRWSYSYKSTIKEKIYYFFTVNFDEYGFYAYSLFYNLTNNILPRKDKL